MVSAESLRQVIRDQFFDYEEILKLQDEYKLVGAFGELNPRYGVKWPPESRKPYSELGQWVNAIIVQKLRYQHHGYIEIRPNGKEIRLREHT